MTATKEPKRTRSKAGRLLLLYLLQRDGVLDYKGAQSDMARWLAVNRSTICRDLREVKRIERIYRELADKQPWATKP